MITTSPRIQGKYTRISRQGRQSAPEVGKPVELGMNDGRDSEQIILVPPYASLITDGIGNYRAIPLHRALSVFNLLPNATSAAAGKDDLYISLGVGTEVIARATKGGINVKTQVTSPATADDAIITGLANNGTTVPLNARSQPRMFTRVSLTQLTLQLFSATLDQTITSVDPTASAGDGAGFVFDPTNACTTGLASGIYTTNWLAYQKVAGADVFTDTGVAVVAAQDIDLDVFYDQNLIPYFLINGNQVAVGTAGTADATMTPLVGVKIVDAGTPAQHDFDIRLLGVERFIG